MDGWMSLSLHPCQHVLSDVVLILDSDYGKMRSQSSFALQYSDDWNVEHIFKCFSANCVSSFENSLLGSAPHFLFGFFSWCSVILVLYFRYQSSIKCIIDKGLFPLCRLLLSPMTYMPFAIHKLFSFMRSLLLFPVSVPVLSVSYWESPFLWQLVRVYSPVSFYQIQDVEFCTGR